MRNEEADHANGSLKRFKCPGWFCECLSKRLDKSGPKAPSKEMIAFGRIDFQNFANSNSAVSVSDEHSQMINQMGQSWFDHYGNLKKEQILPMHDAFKDVAMKASELPFIAGRPDSLTCS
ncbi:hypothetical protein NC652_028741 [Populus alba x Populus x berolinensis]|nr:hypothetical protein NC652_028741 [Populus alba x Populus x berolinensis]